MLRGATRDWRVRTLFYFCMTSPDTRKALSLGEQPAGWQTVTNNKTKNRTKSIGEKKKPAVSEKSYGDVAKEFHEKIMYEAFLEKCTKHTCSGITSQCFKAHDRSSWQSVRRDLRKQEYCARLCYFVQQPDGRCLNGDNCTYAHSKCEVSYHPEVYKTRACHHKPNSTYCGNLLCSFYHVFADGSDDHREPIGANVDNSLIQDLNSVNTSPDENQKPKGLLTGSSAERTNVKLSSYSSAALGFHAEDRTKDQSPQSDNVSTQPTNDNEVLLSKPSVTVISKPLSSSFEENTTQRSVGSVTPLSSNDPIWNFPSTQQSQVSLNPKVIAKPAVNVNLSLAPFLQSQENLSTPPGIKRTSWGNPLDFYPPVTSTETSRVLPNEDDVGKSEDVDTEDKTLFMFKKFLFFYRDFEGPVIYIEPIRAISGSALPAIVREVAHKYEIQHYMLILENIGASRMYLDHMDFVRILQKCEKDESAKTYIQNLTFMDSSKLVLSDPH